MEKFIVTPKEYKKDDRYVTMTIRIERTLQEAYDDLSTKTNRSRNELMGMALRYAIDNMELKDSEWLLSGKKRTAFCIGCPFFILENLP